MGTEVQHPGFFARVGLALKVLGDAVLAGKVAQLLAPAAPTPAQKSPPERTHASALFLLSSLQESGRLVDFLKQDVTAFSDEEIGAAARVVHSGCRKLLDQYVHFQPVLSQSEGEAVIVPTGFDPQRIRLTGNVTGTAPFKGTLKHHGWVAQELRFPAVSEKIDPRVVAPAEVELP